MVIGAQTKLDVLMTFESRWKRGKVYTKNSVVDKILGFLNKKTNE